MLTVIKNKIKLANLIHNINMIYGLVDKGLNNDEIIVSLSEHKIFITDQQLEQIISIRSSNLLRKRISKKNLK